MKTTITIIISVLFVSTCFAQEDLLPAFPREISYEGDVAYFNGSPFTGLLVDEKTHKRLGEYLNGYKNGTFTEYYIKGKKKSECTYVNGRKDGKYITYLENGEKETETTYKYGQIITNGKYEKGKFIISTEKPAIEEIESHELSIKSEDHQNEDDPDMDKFIAVQKMPEIIFQAKPFYPDLAVRSNIQGRVWVKILVSREGKPKKAIVVKSDDEIFNRAAIDAAMKYVFTSALQNDKPVAVWVIVPFKFELRGN